MKVTPIAQEILSNNRYCLPSENQVDKYIEIDTVKFGSDAYMLAGPFNEHYGLLYISKANETRTFDEILADIVDEAKYSIGTFPWKYQAKLEEAFGKSVDFYWNETTKQSISSIDVAAKGDRSGYHNTGKKCSLFAETNKGRGLLLSPLTTKEIEEAQTYSIEKRCKWITDAIKSTPCKERPYYVRLQGTDDSAWGRSFSYLEECYALVRQLKERGFDAVNEHMDFTN